MLATTNLRLQLGNKLLCSTLNLQCHPGQFWCLLGPNGSGKTTLLHSLAGLHKPSEGQIYLENQLLHKIPIKKRAKQIGLLLQTNEKSLHHTVYDSLTVARHPHRTKKWQHLQTQDKEIINNALQQMDLQNYQQRKTHSLSGGEQQRLQIAMLLTQSPNIYLLDEPTNHLDLHYQIKTLNLLKQLAQQQNKLIIAAIHDINLAYQFADHACLFFNDGKPLCGKIKEIFTAKNLSMLYNQSLEKIEAGSQSFWICKPGQ